MAGILYGYTRSEKGIIAAPQKSQAVKMIFSDYLLGASLIQLIEQLYEENIPHLQAKKNGHPLCCIKCSALI